MREIFVEETFASKTVLVTGATGFLGKVLIEKLLRSCPGVEKIFVLLRAKNDESLESRFEALKNLIVFDKVKEINEKLMDKVVVVNADLLISPCAGILSEDQKTLKETVNVVFHCAAAVKFDEPLKNALQINTIATRNMLDLAAKFDKLDAFVHVSTAYANTNQKIIYEKIYKPIYDYNKAIALVEAGADDELEAVTEFALQTFPNTYVFSKNLTEQLVSDRSRELPIAIVRPSVVCPSMSEPFPGWCDSKNGPMGVLLGASTGLLRTVHGNGKAIPDLIPCDFVVNSIIVAGASVVSNENKQLKIYNCTSSKQVPISWNEFLDLSRAAYKEFPSTKAIWFPDGRMCSNYTFYLLYFTLFQLIPACLLDLGLLVTGRKLWFVKLQRKIFDSCKVYTYFLQSTWEWENKNCQTLFHLVSLKER